MGIYKNLSWKIRPQEKRILQESYEEASTWINIYLSHILNIFLIPVLVFPLSTSVGFFVCVFKAALCLPQENPEAIRVHKNKNKCYLGEEPMAWNPFLRKVLTDDELYF